MNQRLVWIWIGLKMDEFPDIVVAGKG